MKDVKCPKCEKVNAVVGLGPAFSGLWKKPTDAEVPIYCGFCGQRLKYNMDTERAAIDDTE